MADGNLNCPNDYVKMTINPQQSSKTVCGSVPHGYIILPSTVTYNFTILFICDNQSPFSGFIFKLFLTKHYISSTTTISTTQKSTTSSIKQNEITSTSLSSSTTTLTTTSDYTYTTTYTTVVTTVVTTVDSTYSTKSEINSTTESMDDSTTTYIEETTTKFRTITPAGNSVESISFSTAMTNKNFY